MKVIKRIIGFLALIFISLFCAFVIIPFRGMHKADDIMEKALNNKVVDWVFEEELKPPKPKKADLIYEAGYAKRSIEDIWIKFHSIGLGHFAGEVSNAKQARIPTIKYHDLMLSDIHNALTYLIQVHDGIIEPAKDCLPENRGKEGDLSKMFKIDN